MLGIMMVRGGVVGGAVCFHLLVASKRCAGQTGQVDELTETPGGSVVVGYLPASGIRLASN